MSFLDKIKRASKGVVDAGAKTMLKVRFWAPSFLFGRRIFVLHHDALLAAGHPR